MDPNDASNLNPQPDASSADEPTMPEMPLAAPAAADGTNRRNFLKAAVVASAAVATVGGAAGAALLSGKSPTQLIRIANFVQSGVCMLLSQGSKLSQNNPNNFLQINLQDKNGNDQLSAFGTLGPNDPDGDKTILFNRCGADKPIYFTLTDKTNSSLVVMGQLVESVAGQDTQGHPKTLYSHQGTDTDLYFAYTCVQGSAASLDDQFPTGSCLQVFCTPPVGFVACS
jgi:hypothetical protein